MIVRLGFRLVLLAVSLAPAASPVAAPVANPPGRYAPRDECARQPGAAAFRATLARAVARCDAVAISGMSTAKVELDFGGGEGRGEMRRRSPAFAKAMLSSRSTWSVCVGAVSLRPQGCVAIWATG